MADSNPSSHRQRAQTVPDRRADAVELSPDRVIGKPLTQEGAGQPYYSMAGWNPFNGYGPNLSFEQFVAIANSQMTVQRNSGSGPFS